MQGMPAPGEFTNSTLCQSPASRRERAFRPGAVVRQANTSVYFGVLLLLWRESNSVGGVLGVTRYQTPSERLLASIKLTALMCGACQLFAYPPLIGWLA